MKRIRKMYKIHHHSVAYGWGKSAGNDVFYETEEEAIEMASSYCNPPHTATGMVIYKAYLLIRPSKPPVEVLSIRRSGEVIPL